MSDRDSTRKLLEDARAAFVRADWEIARDLYERALASERSGDALDGLGQTLWWLGERDAGIELRAKAFREYRGGGDAEPAAYIATYLAAEYRIAGNASLARGWLGRAERLLDGLGECSSRGWLHVELSKRAPDPIEEEQHAREAVEIARRLNDPDLEFTALSHVGLAQISNGEVDAGLATLEEAMAGAMGGEAEDPLAIGETCCITLVACEQLADAQRARDWSQAIVEFVERRRFTPLFPWCRAVYAGFLVGSGRWNDAERELERSLQEYRRLGALPLTTLKTFADLRIRQGRLEEAAQLLGGNEDRAAVSHPMVQLHLARDEIDLAAEKTEERLQAVAGNDAYAAPLLPLQAAVCLARGDSTGAARVAEELAAVAGRLGREDLASTAKVLAARAARAAGEHPDLAALEDAVEQFSRLELPLEAAEARLELARGLATRRPRLAAERARSALGEFERLGAARHADETAKLLRDLGMPGRRAPRTPGTLTRREQEVLELLAAGLSNAAIAERLVISPKTAEHHVGRILGKLGLRSRAEAAAYAARSGGRS